MPYYLNLLAPFWLFFSVPSPSGSACGFLLFLLPSFFLPFLISSLPFQFSVSRIVISHGLVCSKLQVCSTIMGFSYTAEASLDEWESHPPLLFSFTLEDFILYLPQLNLHEVQRADCHSAIVRVS